MRWQSGRLRVVQHGSLPPQLQVYDGPDGEEPTWYAPALPWGTCPGWSGLILELVSALAREGDRR